jgi:hypothetical protein
LTPPFSVIIYNSAEDTPTNWDDFATSNVFLSKEYLKVLELASPLNITCHFIGFFKENELVGIAIAQFFDLNKQSNFGERDQCFKTYARNFVFKNLASHVIIMGNNMLTGQNAFSFSEKINSKQAFEAIITATKKLKEIYKNKGIKTHLISYKDFENTEIESLKPSVSEKLYKFSTQPNMVFDIPKNWNSETDYIDALLKKYRDQYKRARKKCENVEKRKLSLQDIVNQEDVIYDLYFHVAKNAPFNTFFLPKNHFSVFKELMKEKFLFYGYYLDNKMIGFNTIIKNGTVIDTYFLGYDDTIQKDKMLYLNMLYDMIGYSIKKQFEKIIFARTALEIKSSVGAKPIEMFGFIKHENTLLNSQMERIFNFVEPKTIWNERNPFK